jgi:uncharacterized protein DUF5320
MPGFDGTGPRGMGPMTGGGRGFCAIPMPYATPRGTPYYGSPPLMPEMAREEELDYLKGLAQSMRNDLKEIETRLQEIENEKE